MKPITKGIIALIIAIVVALCGSLLLSFNILTPFATLFKLERDASQKGHIIYPEHNDDYLRECINLLKEKNAPIDWEKVEKNLG